MNERLVDQMAEKFVKGHEAQAVAVIRDLLLSKGDQAQHLMDMLDGMRELIEVTLEDAPVFSGYGKPDIGRGEAFTQIRANLVKEISC